MKRNGVSEGRARRWGEAIKIRHKGSVFASKDFDAVAQHFVPNVLKKNKMFQYKIAKKCSSSTVVTLWKDSGSPWTLTPQALLQEKLPSYLDDILTHGLESTVHRYIRKYNL